ncbi:hypothetical protein C0J52_11321 [Blattella germanica]|nr:hypothetical protein C0J52_11321 [Blattella germanica]
MCRRYRQGRPMQGDCGPQTIVLYITSYWLSFQNTFHIKIVFYTNQIQSNFILRGARTLLLVKQATDVLMPFPPPLDCQYILRFKHECFLPSPSSFMRPLPDCILCSQGAIFGCRLCLSSARAISVKCFEVPCFFLFGLNGFKYIYLYLKCALCSPPKCYFYDPPLGIGYIDETWEY